MTQKQTEKTPTEKKQAEKAETQQDSTRILYTQIFVCLFLAAVLFFARKEGGPLWADISGKLRGFLENGVSFSGQQELTRFTDEVRDFWGNIVEAFLMGTAV